MKRTQWIAIGISLLLGSTVQAQSGSFRDPTSRLGFPTTFRICTKHEIEKINRSLTGQLVDLTYNHREDRRIYSAALDARRDLYVYLPPKYDPNLAYPAMIFMHGFTQDERTFLDLIPYADRAIAEGQLPPMIIAAPDGSIEGRPSMFQAGSFYINSKAGRFEDYIIQDVWGAVTKHFKVRPEREAHLLTGSSMGGFGAFNLGIKHRDQFAIVAGIHPPLNLRYQDCRGRYFSDYDPTCVSYREDYRPFAPVARFYGIITVRQRQLAAPLFDQKSDVMAMIAKENPIEMLDSYRVKPGELSLFAGYGGRDQFNIDAQIESFVDAATARGITIKTVKDPRGDHSTETGLKLFPYFCYWVAPLLKDYPPIPIK